MDENEFLELQIQAEEYQDFVDIMHPEDKIEPKLNTHTLPSGFSHTYTKLAIVVGHTLRSPGALGVNPISMHEYHWNKNLANHILFSSRVKNIECGIFFRDGVGISGAYEQVKSFRPHSCIELHFNAFNRSVKGTETLYGSSYIYSKDWAQAMQNSMVNLFGRIDGDNTNRGIKKRLINQKGHRGAGSVNQLKNIPSCLIEPFFGDEHNDAMLGFQHLYNLANTILDTHNRVFT